MRKDNGNNHFHVFLAGHLCGKLALRIPGAGKLESGCSSRIDCSAMLVQVADYEGLPLDVRAIYFKRFEQMAYRTKIICAETG